MFAGVILFNAVCFCATSAQIVVSHATLFDMTDELCKRKMNDVSGIYTYVFRCRLRIEAMLIKEEFINTVDWIRPVIDAVILTVRGI